MNKCMCASMISLRRFMSCSRNDIRCSVLYFCTPPLSQFLVCTFIHTNIRWLLLSVVRLYDLKELQIKFSLDVTVLQCVCISSWVKMK